MADLDDLPSLDEIFARPTPTKKVKVSDKENKQENKKSNEADKVEKKVDHLAARPKIAVNTAVFVMDFFNKIYVPGIVTGFDKENYNYTVKCYNGNVEKISRKYVHSPDDKEFYSLTTIALKKVLESKSEMIRQFNKENMIKIIGEEKEEILEILKGDLESKRDVTFFSGIQKRSTMNSDNRPGPFTLEEYNFLLEYFPKVLIPKCIKESKDLLAVLEKRFEKTGSSLDQLLRHYAHLVLVPEFTVRRILKIDLTVKTYEEANEKYLNDLKAYDEATGNFINYLYSRKEMYQYAYREKRVDEAD